MTRMKLSRGRALVTTIAIVGMALAITGCDWANVGGLW
jgi:hypothetical protein